MNQELQNANDLLQAMEQQRNNLANQLAHAQAALLAANRTVSEVQQKLDAATARVADLECIPKDASPNGHDAAAPVQQ